jgi:hypothetical protein
VGSNVTLEVVLDPILPEQRGDPPVWLLSHLDLGPVISNLGDRSGAIAPDVPLSSLAPEKTVLPVEGATLQNGRLTDGQPLAICGYPFAEGYGVPPNTELKYTLDPSWTRFVAVIGRTGGTGYIIGPFQVVLDEDVLLETGAGGIFDTGRQAVQVDVEIPRGHSTITLKIPMPAATQHAAFGAWAHAGFMTD